MLGIKDCIKLALVLVVIVLVYTDIGQSHYKPVAPSVIDYTRGE
jgi:hypothetical protein